MENSGERYAVPHAYRILDAIDIGRMESQKKTQQEIQKAIQQFAVK